MERQHKAPLSQTLWYIIILQGPKTYKHTIHTNFFFIAFNRKLLRPQPPFLVHVPGGTTRVKLSFTVS